MAPYNIAKSCDFQAKVEPGTIFALFFLRTGLISAWRPHHGAEEICFWPMWATGINDCVAVLDFLKNDKGVPNYEERPVIIVVANFFPVWLWWGGKRDT
jgi:hypothetical protein